MGTDLKTLSSELLFLSRMVSEKGKQYFSTFTWSPEPIHYLFIHPTYSLGCAMKTAICAFTAPSERNVKSHRGKHSAKTYSGGTEPKSGFYT